MPLTPQFARGQGPLAWQQLLRQNQGIIPALFGSSAPVPIGTDGHVEAAAQGTAVTSALPTGFTFDGTQFCLLTVSHGSGSGGSGTTITTPAGWNLLVQPDGFSTRIAVFWRFLQLGDAAPSFTLGTSRAWCSHSTAFSGVHPTIPINTQALQALDYASASSYTSPTISPAVDNCTIVACWGGKTGTDPLRQTVTIPAGWTDTTGGTSSPTTPNQSVIAAVNNNWATFQYKAQTTATSVSEAVTVANSATAQIYIIALNPAPAATGGESHAGAASGEQHTDGISTGAKGAAGTALGATRVSGFTTGSKGAAGAALGPTRTAGLVTVRKQAAAATVGQQRTGGIAVRGAPFATGIATGQQRVTGITTGIKGAVSGTSGQQRTAGLVVIRKQAAGAPSGSQRTTGTTAGAKQTLGAATGQQRTAGLAGTTPPPPSGAATGQQRVSGFITGRKGTTATAASGQQRSAGVTTGIHRAAGAASGQQRTAGSTAGTKGGRGATSGQQRSGGLAVGLIPAAFAKAFGQVGDAGTQGVVTLREATLGAAELDGTSGTVLVASQHQGTVTVTSAEGKVSVE